MSYDKRRKRALTHFEHPWFWGPILVGNDHTYGRPFPPAAAPSFGGDNFCKFEDI